MPPVLNFGGRMEQLHNPVPSLQHFAAVTINTIIWTQNDIRHLLSTFRCQELHELNGSWEESTSRWKVIEEEVKKRMRTFELPREVTQTLLNFVKPIGQEIRRWKEFHELMCDQRIDLPQNICWTSRGTIDTKQTAERMLNDNNLDGLASYKLAAVYCSEGHIKELWTRMPDAMKKSFTCRKYLCIGDLHVLPAFWAYMMENIPTDDLFSSVRRSHFSLLQCVFHHAVFRCILAAAEFFWQKLNLVERTESLEKSIKDAISLEHFYMWGFSLAVYQDEMKLFLLAQMNEQQQTYIMKEHGSKVLLCFLNWPRQNLFLQVANRFWDVLPNEDFWFVLRTITDKIEQGYEDCKYHELLAEFWEQSPKALKTYIMNDLS